MKVKANSSTARLLHALNSNKWVSVSEIKRRTQINSLSSRVNDLRKKGLTIEHREVKGKARADLRHQYRWIGKPSDPVLPPLDPAVDRITLNRDEVPRDPEHRFRIYITDENNKLHLMGTAATESKLGVELCRL